MRRPGLGEREAGPEPRRLEFGPPGDLPSPPAYIGAWHLWRAIRRDAVLNDDELLAQWTVAEEHIRRRLEGRG